MKSVVKNAVIIVAGGSGLRVGADIPKQFLILGNKPMLMHTIEKFYAFDSEMLIVVVLHADYFNYWKELCEKYQFKIPCELVKGGDTRFQSVKNGLSCVPAHTIVGVHDAARPFVSTKLIAQCYRLSRDLECGIIPVIDEKNSLRQIVGSSHQPLDRTHVKIVQTPQVFPAQIIKEAYTGDFQDQFTDDATVVETNGHQINLIAGEDVNIKITTTTDLHLAQHLIEHCL